VQRLVYFVSEVLSESKIHYSTIQKLLYAILITSRKFHHYFNAHNILVVTDFPLVDILNNRDATEPSPSGQWNSGLTLNFMAEWRGTQEEAPANPLEHWVMYFDGSLKLGGGGARVLFISPIGEQLKYVFQILFEVSNNEAEYEALLHGLCLAVSLGIERLLVCSDSLLVI
jgi:hypothetical protein